MAKPKTKSVAVKRNHDTLLVVGTAPCMFDDIEEWWDFEHPHDVCVINEAARLFPCDFNHIFSFHTDWLRDRGLGGDEIHTVRRGGRTFGAHAWRLRDTGGSSGFMAARCALKYWGYRKVVVAGCPLTNDGHFSSMEVSSDWFRYTETFLPAWRRHYPALKGSLRSMSGNTKAIYGPPTKEWLNDVNDC